MSSYGSEKKNLKGYVEEYAHYIKVDGYIISKTK